MDGKKERRCLGFRVFRTLILETEWANIMGGEKERRCFSLGVLGLEGVGTE